MGQLFDSMIGFGYAYPLVAAGIALGLVVLVYFKPKESMKIGFCILAILAFIYFVQLFTGTIDSGLTNKREMISPE